MQKKILASMMVIGLVATLAGAGLYAYFSDTETSTGNIFTAGTIDLQLEDSDDGFGTTVTATWSAPNWAPGDYVEAELRFKNVGTTGAKMLRISGEKLVEYDAYEDADPDIADRIVITKIMYSEYGEYMPWNLAGYYAGVLGDKVAPLTLEEFVDPDDVYEFDTMIFWIGAHPPTEDYLPAGGVRVEKLTLGFEFLEGGEGDNVYQGDSASFDLKAVATDDTTISGGEDTSYGYK